MSSLAFARSVQLKQRSLLVVILAAILLIVLPGLALAHPLGNFTINRYSRLEIGTEQVMLIYIVDMAEIPTQQERAQIDTNGDGQFSIPEQERYLAKLLETLQSNLHLVINGDALSWAVEQSELTFPEGQAGLPTLRIDTRFSTGLPSKVTGSDATWQADYRDDNFADRLGWQEVVVQSAAGINLLDSSVPTTDLSQALTHYPDDLLQTPPTVNHAAFGFTTFGFVGGAAGSTTEELAATVATSASSAGESILRTGDPFAELIRLPVLGPWAIFLALLAAFGWGAIHALSPGHGKTIVGAYLVGSRGTAKHALFLGLVTTITHTAGVFALGLITLFASRYILPETLFPWLSLLSGLMVVVIGLMMVWGWLRQRPIAHVHAHYEAQDHHYHDHSHHHEHEHHSEGSDNHVHKGLHSHDGIHYHSHDVPGQDGTPVTWRSLLALGISGGLLPCPSALVVMLGAIALERIAFGLVLIVAFSLGLAGVLTAFGLVLVYAGRFFSQLPESRRFVKVMPVVSSLFIVAVGTAITWQALMTVL